MAAGRAAAEPGAGIGYQVKTVEGGKNWFSLIMKNPSLRLVWNNGATVAQAGKSKSGQPSVGGQEPSASALPVNWVSQVAAAVAVVGFILGGGFYFGTLQMRTEFGERVASIETNTKGLEKKIDIIFEEYVLKDKDLQTKAAKVIKTENVRLSYVKLRSNATFSVPDKTPSVPIAIKDTKTTKTTVHVLYSLEGVQGGSLIMRVQINNGRQV